LFQNTREVNAWVRELDLFTWKLHPYLTLVLFWPNFQKELWCSGHWVDGKKTGSCYG